MTREKEEVVIITVMIISVLNWTGNKSATAGKAKRTMHKALAKEFLKPTGKFHIEVKAGKFIKTPIRREDERYTDIAKRVNDAWLQVDEELINDNFRGSTAELIQMLWDRTNGNKYQTRYIGEKHIISAINSIGSAVTGEYGDEITLTNNSRKVANRFFELLNVKPQHNLSTRKKIIAGNIILENA